MGGGGGGNIRQTCVRDEEGVPSRDIEGPDLESQCDDAGILQS